MRSAAAMVTKLYCDWARLTATATIIGLMGGRAGVSFEAQREIRRSASRGAGIRIIGSWIIIRRALGWVYEWEREGLAWGDFWSRLSVDWLQWVSVWVSVASTRAPPSSVASGAAVSATPLTSCHHQQATS